MRRILRLLTGLLLVVGGARMALFLAYAAYELPTPLEAYYLEAKMVHLAWRVQQGLALYPDWESYPHVANFYGPCYFVAVGLLGRALGASLEGLFVVGRAVSLGAALLTSVVLGVALGRRHGAGAGWAGAVLSLGASPMHGFAVVTRPDTAADLFGLAGFLLATARRPAAAVAGGALLVVAALTKQTAGAYLLAAALAMAMEGRRGRAAAMLVGCGLAAGAVALVVTLTAEPGFVAGLTGDAKTPWSLSYWWTIVGLLARTGPDLIVFAVLGLVLWNTGGHREVGPTALAAVLLATSVVTAAKEGSSLNYFLGLRVVEGMAVATLWREARRPPEGARGRVALAAALVVGIASLVPGTLYMVSGVQGAVQSRAILEDSVQGKALVALYGQFFRMAGDPDARLLTDDGLIDIYRRERTIFGDPHLLRVLVQTGQLDPVTLVERADRAYYELVVTRRDLFSPAYDTYEFGLPMPVVERLRARYRPAGSLGSQFFYAVPREGGPMAVPGTGRP